MKKFMSLLDYSKLCNTPLIYTSGEGETTRRRLLKNSQAGGNLGTGNKIFKYPASRRI